MLFCLTYSQKNGFWRGDYQSGTETLEPSHTLSWKWAQELKNKPPKQITFQGTASLSLHGTGHPEKENATSFTSKFVSEACLQKPENPSSLTSEYRAADLLFLTKNLDCYPQVNISHPLNNCHCSDSGFPIKAASGPKDRILAEWSDLVKLLLAAPLAPERKLIKSFHRDLKTDYLHFLLQKQKHSMVMGDTNLPSFSEKWK